MKPTTANIQNWINNKEIQSQIDDIFNKNPSFQAYEMNVNETQDAFNYCKEKIEILLEKAFFDKLNFHKRNAIWNLLNNISDQLNQAKQYGNSLTQRNIGNNLYSYIYSLKDQIDSILIQVESGYYDYEKETKELIKIKRRFTKLVNDIDGAEQLLKSLQTNEKKYNELLEAANNGNKRVIQLRQEADTVLKDINSNYDNSNNRLKNIQSIEQEIENKKLSINSFSNNIKEYKQTVEHLINQTKALLEKEEKINQLILQAEKALNLKSAEGISAAFATQYRKADDKELYKGWLLGALCSIFIAVLLTIWIVTGLWIKEADSLSSIVGRIVAVGIAVTSATFCAKQYTNQKRIAEDYAYKATLSKSIIAFTDEIKKRDDQQVTSYLTKVLDEIHKDPLRSRKDDDESLNEDNINLVKKILNLIPKGS